jgi:hypothetical protein
MNDTQDFSHIMYDENDNEPSDIVNEPDDSSLRDIYTGQTQCYYCIRIRDRIFGLWVRYINEKCIFMY